MSRSFAYLPVKRIALYGFTLAMISDSGQCFIFYDMGDGSFWHGTIWIRSAIARDGLIVLTVAVLAGLIAGPSRLTLPQGDGWTALFLIGFVAGLFSEWLVRILDLPVTTTLCQR